jgi:hypothetical protein
MSFQPSTTDVGNVSLGLLIASSFRFRLLRGRQDVFVHHGERHSDGVEFSAFKRRSGCALQSFCHRLDRAFRVLSINRLVLGGDSHPFAEDRPARVDAGSEQRCANVLAARGLNDRAVGCAVAVENPVKPPCMTGRTQRVAPGRDFYLDVSVPRWDAVIPPSLGACRIAAQIPQGMALNRNPRVVTTISIPAFGPVQDTPIAVKNHHHPGVVRDRARVTQFSDPRIQNRSRHWLTSMLETWPQPMSELEDAAHRARDLQTDPAASEPDVYARS